MLRRSSAEALAAAVKEHAGLDTLVVDDSTRWCAAIGAAHVLWRDGPLEDLHAGMGQSIGISDGEMMRANVVTTRIIADALADGLCDWRKLADDITDSDRPIGEKVLSELVGASNVAPLRRHAIDSAARLDDLSRDDWRWLRTYLACSGATREWFGVPWWPQHVNVFVSEVTDPDSGLHSSYRDRDRALPDPPLALATIASGLLTAPESLPAHALSWCVDAALLGYVDRQEVRQRWKAAECPRWAPSPLRS